MNKASVSLRDKATSFFQPTQGMLQRKCDCGNKTIAGGECTECAKKTNRLQRKLTIGASNDPLEREADRVADQVMGMSTNSSIRKTPPRIQRFASQPIGQSDTVPASVNRVLASSGRPLEPVLRHDMEQRFGSDFSQVRVYTDSTAEQSVRDVSAHAYTVGNNVVFGAGQFSPETNQGSRLLAHELTHVVQQSNRQSNNSVIQRDLAIQPRHPDANGRVLTPAEIQAAITFNNQVLSNIANSAAIIQLIRDVFGRGINPTPAVVDNDFVRGVVDWQAVHGLTQDGKLGPRTARPLFREIGAEGEGKGKVKRGPRYNPAGPINVPGGAVRQATFNMFAEFDSDLANKFFPSCCEVRQDIRWDATFVASSVAQPGGLSVPHTGFPATHPAGRWIEDRNQTNTLRYGHRARFNRGNGNQYLDTSGRQNLPFGHIFRGRDTPSGLVTDQGSWSFRLRVIDVCNGNRLLATSRTLILNWL